MYPVPVIGLLYSGYESKTLKAIDHILGCACDPGILVCLTTGEDFLMQDFYKPLCKIHPAKANSSQ